MDNNSNNNKEHVLITGTGRAGTTALVMLLTKLGIETGFKPDTMQEFIFKNCNAGLEKGIWNDDAPFIIKQPIGRINLEVVLKSKCIKHVFIPIREIHEAAQSRIHVYEQANVDSSSEQSVPGGLCLTKEPRLQKEILQENLLKQLVILSQYNIDATLIHYPKLTKDSQYLYSKLQPMISHIPFDAFQEVFTNTINTNLVHEYNEPSA